MESKENIYNKIKMSNIFEEIRRNGPKVKCHKPNVKSDKEYDAQCYRNIRDFQLSYSWAIPCEEAIECIYNFAEKEKILEIGAGLGLWAQLLKLRGADILAIDNFISHTDKNKERYFYVEDLDANSAMQKYDDAKILLMIWPPMTNMASDAVKIFNGNKIIYIGEYREGCTGNSSFFDILESEWNLVNNIDIPNWYTTRDSLFLYSKK